MDRPTTMKSEFTKFDLELYDPAPSEELVCTVCRCVFEKPMETPCRHVFCDGCIARWLVNNSNCPNCRKTMLKFQLKPVLPIVQNMINKLQMKCENKDSGCMEKICFESYDSHKKECQYAVIGCPNARCLEFRLRKNMKEHQEQDCEFRLVRCTKDCELEVPYTVINTHSCVAELKRKLGAAEETLERVKQTVFNEFVKKQEEIMQKLTTIFESRQRARSSSNSSSDLSSDWDVSSLSLDLNYDYGRPRRTEEERSRRSRRTNFQDELRAFSTNLGELQNLLRPRLEPVDAARPSQQQSEADTRDPNVSVSSDAAAVEPPRRSRPDTPIVVPETIRTRGRTSITSRPIAVNPSTLRVGPFVPNPLPRQLNITRSDVVEALYPPSSSGMDSSNRANESAFNILAPFGFPGTSTGAVTSSPATSTVAQRPDFSYYSLFMSRDPAASLGASRIPPRTDTAPVANSRTVKLDIKPNETISISSSSESGSDDSYLNRPSTSTGTITAVRKRKLDTSASTSTAGAAGKKAKTQQAVRYTGPGIWNVSSATAKAKSRTRVELCSSSETSVSLSGTGSTSSSSSTSTSENEGMRVGDTSSSQTRSSRSGSSSMSPGEVGDVDVENDETDEEPSYRVRVPPSTYSLLMKYGDESTDESDWIPKEEDTSGDDTV